MAVTKFVSRVAEKNFFNQKFCLVKFELVEPSRLEFQSGQYIMMTVPETPQKKSYSIASTPDIAHAVEVLVDISPGGPGSRFLQTIKPGDQAEFMAPAGRFVMEPRETPIGQEEDQIVFIATGSGISPIRSMILDQLLSKRDTRPIKLHWGLRFVEDMFWEEDFYQLSDDYTTFDVDIVLSKPPGPEWKLCEGHVTDCLIGHPREFSRTGFYLCGNERMIEDAKTLLSERGVKPEHIHHEQFY